MAAISVALFPAGTGEDKGGPVLVNELTYIDIRIHERGVGGGRKDR